MKYTCDLLIQIFILNNEIFVDMSMKSYQRGDNMKFIQNEALQKFDRLNN